MYMLHIYRRRYFKCNATAHVFRTLGVSGQASLFSLTKSIALSEFFDPSRKIEIRELNQGRVNS